MSWWYGREYESVAEKREKALKRIKSLRKKHGDIKPVFIEGRTLAGSFWGKAWCRHMDQMADYENRLPRGRSYVRHGAVCHLDIRRGEVEAWVSGTRMYTVTIRFAPLAGKRWENIQKACKGKIATLVELLQGKLSREVMAVVSHPETGLFPGTDEITFTCSCPDWASLCKHVAAVFYGIGRRLDDEPELLFLLRGVDPQDLFTLDAAAPAGGDGEDSFQGVDLGGLFGIDLAGEAAAAGASSAPEDEAKPRPQPQPQAQAPAPDSASAKTAARPAVRSNDVSPVLPLLDFRRLTGGDIAALRNAAGLSLHNFASLLKMSPATVQRWEGERGILNLHMKSLAKLKMAYEKLSGKRRGRKRRGHK